MKVNKRKSWILLLIVAIVITSVVLKNSFLSDLNNTQSLMPSEKRALAIWIEQDDGTYVESTDRTWPSNMVLDTDKSYCHDGAGYIMENALSYNTSTKKISFSSSEQTFCYLYFKK